MTDKITDPELLTDARVNPGLCGACLHAKRIRSDRNSLFYRCLLSAENPAFVKYPRLPVLSCLGWQKGKPQ